MGSEKWKREEEVNVGMEVQTGKGLKLKVRREVEGWQVGKEVSMRKTIGEEMGREMKQGQNMED